MKKAFVIFLFILVNLILFAAAAVVNVVINKRFERNTVNSFEVGILLLCINGLIYAFYLVVGPNNKIKAVSPGLFMISWALLVSAVFYCNTKFAFPGSYETFRLRRVQAWDGRPSMNIDFNHWAHDVKVSEDKFMEVDSVEARVDKGLLGMQFYSDHIRIMEKDTCEPYTQPDEDPLAKKYSNAAEYYTYRRWFAKAIGIYSDSMKSDPLKQYNYYKRGKLYLVRQDYEKAQQDFYKGAALLYAQLGEIKLEELNRMEVEVETQKLLNQLKTKDYENLVSTVEDLSNTETLRSYERSINFCNAQLNRKELKK